MYAFLIITGQFHPNFGFRHFPHGCDLLADEHPSRPMIKDLAIAGVCPRRRDMGISAGVHGAVPSFSSQDIGRKHAHRMVLAAAVVFYLSLR
jgi:hypothetical protein